MKKASEEQSDKDLDLEKLTECTAEKKKLKSAAYNGFVLLCTAKEEYAGYVKCTTCLKARVVSACLVLLADYWKSDARNCRNSQLMRWFICILSITSDCKKTFPSSVVFLVI